MTLVIYIPDETANAIKDNVMFGVIPSEILWDVTSAIVNGTPLDKIRAEIDTHRETLKTMADDDWYAGKIRGYDCAIEIIDKYKLENEPKESEE